MTKKVLRPTSQKSVYHSAALVYEKLMNDEIPVEKAEGAVKALAVMNTAYANEIKRSKLEGKGLRIIEIKNLELLAEDEQELALNEK